METWDRSSYPLWHGAAPMSAILGAAGPSEVLIRGEGSWVIDTGGRRLLDARAGMSNVMLGYSRHDIAHAMYQQACELPFVCTLRFERPARVTLDYAQALIDVAPSLLTRVRFAHTGSSAVETALQMARRYHRNMGRPEGMWILSLDGSYHGSTLMSLAASGQPILHDLYGPMPEKFRHVLPPDPTTCDACRDPSAVPTCTTSIERAIEEIGPERIAAIIVEPVMGTRAFPLPLHYLRRLRDLCDEFGILLIFDEVVTGFGRIGPMFAADYFGVTPDIMCLAKGITSGYAPLGAVLATDRVFDAFDLPGRPHFALGSTSDAHPVSCAAGLAVLQAYEREDVLRCGREMGERLRLSLVSVLGSSPVVRAVRGIGAFVALDLVDPKGCLAPIDLMRRARLGCQRRNVLVDYTSDVLGLLPPLTLTADESDLLVTTLAEVLDEIAKVGGSTLGRPATNQASVSVKAYR